MGLDMYAYSVRPEDALGDFEIRKIYSSESDQGLFSYPSEDIFYWRKHHDLHGWMFNLAKSKGYAGDEGDFNCVPVRLTEGDLNQLEADLRAFKLPRTQGFFFGNNPPSNESLSNDLDFIQKARTCLKDGFIVYYSSWW